MSTHLSAFSGKISDPENRKRLRIEYLGTLITILKKRVSADFIHKTVMCGYETYYNSNAYCLNSLNLD